MADLKTIHGIYDDEELLVEGAKSFGHQMLKSKMFSHLFQYMELMMLLVFHVHE